MQNTTNIDEFTQEEAAVLKRIAGQVLAAKPRQGLGKKKQCNFRLDEALIEAVKERAAAQGVKMPQIVTWALLDYLDIRD